MFLILKFSIWKLTQDFFVLSDGNSAHTNNKRHPFKWSRNVPKRFPLVLSEELLLCTTVEEKRNNSQIAVFELHWASPWPSWTLNFAQPLKQICFVTFQLFVRWIISIKAYVFYETLFQIFQGQNPSQKKQEYNLSLFCLNQVNKNSLGFLNTGGKTRYFVALCMQI